MFDLFILFFFPLLWLFLLAVYIASEFFYTDPLPNQEKIKNNKKNKKKFR